MAADIVERNLKALACFMMQEPDLEPFQDLLCLPVVEAWRDAVEHEASELAYAIGDQLISIDWPIEKPLWLPLRVANDLAMLIAQKEVANIRALPLGFFTWKPYWMGQSTQFRQQFTHIFVLHLLENTTFTLQNCDYAGASKTSTVERNSERVQWALENRVFYGPSDSEDVAAAYFDPQRLDPHYKDPHKITAEHLSERSILLADLRRAKHTSMYCNIKGHFTGDKFVDFNKAPCSCYMYGHIKIDFPAIEYLGRIVRNDTTMYYAWRYTSPQEREPYKPPGPLRELQDLNRSGLKQVIPSNRGPTSTAFTTRPDPVLLNPELRAGKTLNLKVKALLDHIWGGFCEKFVVGVGRSPGLMLNDWRAELARPNLASPEDESPYTRAMIPDSTIDPRHTLINRNA